jgi:Fe-S cluster assembly protein SufD
MAAAMMGRKATARAAKERATEARLADLAVPEGPAWAAPARREALERVRRMGLPMPRDEYWRFTDPTTLTAAEPPRAGLLDTQGEAPLFGAVDRLRVVFRDGAFDAEASDPLAMEHVEIHRLASSPDLHWARDLYGALEGPGQAPVERPLAALNTALARDGLLIRVTGRAPRPIAFDYRHEAEASDAVLHHVIRVEPGADLTVLENGPAAARFNKCMEVDVADGGAFHHVRAQGRDHERRAVTHLFARVGEGAVFKSFTLTANGRLTRNEAVIDLQGSDAVAHIAGAAVGDGDFHHDDTVFVIHEGQRCESRQVFKKVLRNGAVGVFQGKILVRPGAQKTDGYQLSQALLLDGDAQFLAKPELEIYADDVKCSHGSTSGAIDPTALFYLRSRGVPERDAQDLLVLAFLAEAIEEIEDEAIAEDIRSRLAGWLARRRR